MALHDLTSDQLEAALRDTGRALAGARRDLGADVVAALRSGARAPRTVPRRLAPLVAIAVLLTGAAIASVVVPGIDLRVGRGPSGATRAPLVADPAFLGAPTTLAAARERVDFAVGVPTARQLGTPQVYLNDRPPGGRVSLLYPVNDGLPAMGDTQVGLLLTQFRGVIDEQLLTKVVAEGAEVSPVEVDGLRGWWIDGAHEVLYVDPTGDVVTERPRFADSVVLWVRDGVTLRLESALDRQRAIAIAASVR
jgi:hypothetical protein